MEYQERLSLHSQYPEWFGGFMMDTIGLYALDIAPLHLLENSQHRMMIHNSDHGETSKKLLGGVEHDIDDIEEVN